MKDLVDTSVRANNDSSIDDDGDTAAALTSARLYECSLAITGMTCGSCTVSVENALKGLDGVDTVTVSLATDSARCIYDAAKINSNDLVSHVEDAGFDAEVRSNEAIAQQQKQSDTIKLVIHGMTCVNCSTCVENALAQVPGVESAIVALSTGIATIKYDPTVENCGIRTLVGAVSDAGFDALPMGGIDNNTQLQSLARTREVRAWKRAFRRCAIFATPIVFIHMFAHHIPFLMPILHFELLPGLLLSHVVQLLLVIPIQFGVGKRFYRSSFKAIRHGAATMDVLVCLSTTLAFVYSVLSMVVATVFSQNHDPPNVVFDTCAMVITFITLGKLLENKARGQTSVALSKLLQLKPSEATIYEDPESVGKPDATEKKISSDLLQSGDVVVLKPGAKAPADGIVVHGQGYMNENAITGESRPVFKTKGAHIIGGTMNGPSTVIVFKVTSAGKDTQLSQIVKLVENAQTTKAPVQKFADSVAMYFVPAVLAISLFTLCGWLIVSSHESVAPDIFLKQGRFMTCLNLCISVIVVACPCALGLSTPTAVMVGTGVGAQNGILVKGGSILERTTKVTTVLFDKTGTLTSGNMTVESVHIPKLWKSSKFRTNLWWLLVASVETNSEHPVGKSIVDEAKIRGELEIGGNDGQLILPNVTVDDINVVPGRGIEATVVHHPSNTSYRVIVGNRQFVIDDKGIRLGTDDDDNDNGATNEAIRTEVLVAINDIYAGRLYLADQIRPEAPACVMALQNLGISVAMVTGDQHSTSMYIADRVGISPGNVWSDCAPHEKLQVVEKLQGAASRGDSVAMVGDGINDSPALAKADIGIALSSGTDVAIEAADIILMRSQCLLDVPASLMLSRSIFRRIQLNLVWASIYNIAMIPFAAGIFLPFGLFMPPMAAAAAMMLSSLSVLISSLLLKRWHRPNWMESTEGIHSYLVTHDSPKTKVAVQHNLKQFVAHQKSTSTATTTDSSSPSHSSFLSKIMALFTRQNNETLPTDEAELALLDNH